jgi:hypothetical protein
MADVWRIYAESHGEIRVCINQWLEPEHLTGKKFGSLGAFPGTSSFRRYRIL